MTIILTSASAARLRLMLCASRSPASLVPAILLHSLPARSTRCSRAQVPALALALALTLALASGVRRTRRLTMR